jgi:hypothetical protein
MQDLTPFSLSHYKFFPSILILFLNLLILIRAFQRESAEAQKSRSPEAQQRGCADARKVF